jgi:predicted phage terminase large subunit-like protein
VPALDILARLADRLDPQPPAADYATPGELARALDPNTVQTPALDLIDAALVDVAAGRCDRLIVSMPPQEGKSERTTHVGVLWMLRRNPNLRIGIVSYGEDIARRFSYSIRNDISTFDGSEGVADLGISLRSDTKAAARWNLANPAKGGVYAIGIGGALTGRPLDLLVIDDPVKDYRAADSALLSELAWQWWMSVARPRLAPGAPVIVILTRWHEADLAGRFLAKQAEDEASALPHYDRWRVINIPAQADFDPAKGQSDPLSRQPGEFMLSARGRTNVQWEATKAATSARIWTSLYQGRPSPETGDVLERQWWRRYETPLWTQDPDGSYRIADAKTVIQSWDMAFKDTKSSDFVVGQVWAQRGADVFLVDQVRARLSFSASLAAVRRMTKRWPQAKTKLVEDKANGTAVIDSLKSELGGIIPITPHESKYARASAISPWVEGGNAHLPATPVALFDVEAFIEEATAFPNGAHDDQVDAMSQALGRLLLKPGQGRAFTEHWNRIATDAAALAEDPAA